MKHNLTTLAALAIGLSSLAACSEMAKTQSNGLGGIQKASALQCNQALRDYRSAVDNFSILEGRAPTSEAELAPKYLRSLSDLVDVTPDGQVVVQPGGACD
jgi:hypothetical protein